MNAKLLDPTTNIVDHTQDFTRAAKTLASDLKSEASTRFGGLRDQAATGFSDAQDTVSNVLDSAKSFVKDNPFAAVGLGIVAGLLLSAWARRR